MRGSCLLALTGLLSLCVSFGEARTGDPGEVPPPPPDRVRYVRTPRVQVDFRLRTDPAAVTGVQLWFTADLSRTWQQANLGDQRTSPITWPAPHDGLYGLYLVLENTAGVSSEPPTAGTAPQQWVFLDTTPPRLRFLDASPDANFSTTRRLLLRWSAADDNPTDRPIGLHYKPEGATLFLPIATDLDNVGSYAWTVPDSVHKSFVVKVSASDRAGHLSEALSKEVVLERFSDVPLRDATRASGPSRANSPAAANAHGSQPRKEAAGDGTEASRTGSAPAESSLPDSIVPPSVASDETPATLRARALYRQASAHRLRGDWDLAAQRLHEALELDPRLADARLDLAGVLFKQKHFDGSEREYRRLLADDPERVNALRGLALVQATRAQYPASRQTLRKLLALRPDDAEIWLFLGDVTFFMGDRPAARQAWGRASSLGKSDGDLAERARKRLAIYPVSSEP